LSKTTLFELGFKVNDLEFIPIGHGDCGEQVERLRIVGRSVGVVVSEGEVLPFCFSEGATIIPAFRS
jgi:hypothetical protein